MLVQSRNMIVAILWFMGLNQQRIASAEDCKLTPVIHVLQAKGCNSLPIPSFACVGRCSSYVQVSGAKMWQTERSCMCCQESGVRETTVTLSCPQAAVKTQKVATKAPYDCMCRPCTTLDEASVMPGEMAGFIEDGSILSMIPPNLIQL